MKNSQTPEQHTFGTSDVQNRFINTICVTTHIICIQNPNIITVDMNRKYREFRSGCLTGWCEKGYHYAIW